jgi:HTH-type transcriptional regulator/antitoxin HipB
MIVRTPRDLGAAVRTRRRTLTLDQADLARQVGVSRQWLIGLEQGRPRAELALVLRTLRVLGLELDVQPEAPAPESSAAIDDVLARARRRS